MMIFVSEPSEGQVWDQDFNINKLLEQKRG
jgi:hypothetical protein